ncbi:MAG: hypothetical protein ACFFD8_07855 [Candidatus Thorarchaeota archaeon]
MRLKRKEDDRPLSWHDLWFLEASISLILVGGVYVIIAQFFAVLTPFLVIVVFIGISGLIIVVAGLYMVAQERRLGRRFRFVEPVSNIENLTHDQYQTRQWDQWIKRQYGKKQNSLHIVKQYPVKTGSD